MSVALTRWHRCIARQCPRSDRSGSTLPELAVAAALLLSATAMAGGTVLAPLVALSRIAAVDEDEQLLTTALDAAARVVRAGRPTIDAPAVRSFDVAADAATLRLGMHGPEGIGEAILVLDDALRLSVEGSALPLPVGLLVDGLDGERSRIELLTASGTVIDDHALHEVVGVRLVLRRGELERTRTILLRARHPLEAVHR
jgi:hypothetical protein